MVTICGHRVLERKKFPTRAHHIYIYIYIYIYIGMRHIYDGGSIRLLYYNIIL